jgi:5'-deoxynucleotidase YfbR-like HD superfamily hydrolase
MFEREEIALKFLACTIRSLNPDFADSVLDLWHDYEDGATNTAVLVQELDKLECIHQAVVYEQRSGVDLSKLIDLKEMVTLPALQPLSNECLQKYDEIKTRKEKHLVVIFVSSEFSRYLIGLN